MDEFRLLILAAIGVPSLILALWNGGKWEEKHPEKLGFKWGYFVIYNTLINNILLCRKHRVVVIDAMEAAVRLAVAAIGVSTPQKRRQMGSHQTIPQ